MSGWRFSLARREFLLGLGGVGLLAASGSSRGANDRVSAGTDTTTGDATRIPALEPERIAQLLEERLGRFEPVEGGLRLELPALAESGNSVPLTLGVEEAGRELDDPVRRLLVVATRNPHPLLLDARFGALARPRLTTNIRLAETQTVLAYAQLASGVVRSTRADIRVTIGACQHLDFRY